MAALAALAAVASPSVTRPWRVRVGVGVTVEGRRRRGGCAAAAAAAIAPAALGAWALVRVAHAVPRGEEGRGFRRRAPAAEAEGEEGARALRALRAEASGALRVGVGGASAALFAAALFRQVTNMWAEVVGPGFGSAWEEFIGEAGAGESPGAGQARRGRGPVILFDMHGEEICRLYGQDHAALRLNEVSPYLLLSVEGGIDRNYRRHVGVDLHSVARDVAAHAMYLAGARQEACTFPSLRQPTVTQRLAHETFTAGKEASLRRKIADSLLAVAIELNLDKDRILELYLNRVYFGAGIRGVELASMAYFDKSPKDLTLGEAAMMAGLVESSRDSSPLYKPLKARQARDRVLLRLFSVPSRRMSLTQDLLELELRSPLKFKMNSNVWFRKNLLGSNRAPWFVSEVVHELTKILGGDGRLSQGGLHIYTTVDLGLQEMAEALLAGSESLCDDEEAALVAIEPSNGSVRTLVGGRNYSISLFNRATQARRSPGSTLKPFAFLAALEKGLKTSSTLLDDPIYFPEEDWSPQNYDRHFRGPVTLEKALVNSLNVPTVRLVQDIGVHSFVRMLRRCGAEDEIDANHATVLGACEMTPLDVCTMYSTLAAEGIFRKPTTIHRIEEVNDITGEHAVLYRDRELVRDPARSSFAGGRSRAGPLDGTPLAPVVKGFGSQLDEWRKAHAQRRRRQVPSQADVDFALGMSPLGPVAVPGERVASISNVRKLNHMLRKAILKGTGAAAGLEGNRECCGKTGTANGHRDAWFTGYTPQLACTVWVGRDNNKPMRKRGPDGFPWVRDADSPMDGGENPPDGLYRPTGGSLAAPLWAKYMSAAHRSQHPEGESMCRERPCEHDLPLLRMPVQADHDEEEYEADQMRKRYEEEKARLRAAQARNSKLMASAKPCWIHICKDEDTVESIAKLYQVASSTVTAYTPSIAGLPTDVSMSAGTALFIPVPVKTYVAREGDTLTHIAWAGGFSVAEVLALNTPFSYSSMDDIHVGDKVFLPKEAEFAPREGELIAYACSQNGAVEDSLPSTIVRKDEGGPYTLADVNPVPDAWTDGSASEGE